jgi:Ca-activated chloride channel family protein
VTDFGVVHDALVGSALLLGALGLAALAAGRAIARRRRRALFGAAAPRGAAGGDALLALAIAVLCLALAGPYAGRRIERVPATGADVVLLFDVSQSMLAADAPPSRLERARALAGAVLSGLGAGDRAALAAFAGRGVLLTPLTPDRDALRELLPAVDPLLFADPGSRFDAGVREAIRAFRPESPRPRVLLLLSDGEDPERNEASGLEAIAPLGVRVVAVAFGSEAGAPIPVRGGVLHDRSGRPVASRADTARLAVLADRTGGALFRTDRFGRVDAAAVVAAVRRDAASDTEGFVDRSVPRSLVPALAALALVLLLVEAAVARRTPRATGWAAPVGGFSAPRASDSAATVVGFSAPRASDSAATVVGSFSAGAARTSPIAVLALGSLAAIAVAATAADDPPGESADSPVANLSGIEKRPNRELDARALLRLGIARAEAGELADAERAFFGAAARAEDTAVAGDALFDLGVAALARSDLEAARDAFFDAIALAPDDREAQWNLEWTLRALGKQPPPPDRGGKPDEKERDESERQEGQPDESGEADPDSAPQPGEAAPQEAPRDGQPTRQNPVTLDPAAAKRVLDSVTDDPGRALQAAAQRAERSPRPRGGSGSPLW